ncbi:MAG: 4-hydroxy-tetrahydrodipicolinate synthase [Tenacibaculum sp.]
MQKFVGMGVALVTPFKEDLSIDFDALKKLVIYNIENGTDYLVINGTTAESATISWEEKLEIIELIVKTNQGRLPVVLGVGANNTLQVVDELQRLNLNDIDAVLSVAPYYNKPTQEGFYQHFRSVAQASPKPVILYNVPGRTAKNILPKTSLQLAADFPNIIGIKEAGNNQQQYYELLKNKAKDFLVISGDDDLALGVVLAGGAGVISVIGQAFPKDFSTMIHLGLKGKNKDAFALYYKLMDGIKYIFEENNPAGIKAVLKKLDISSDVVRLPLVSASCELQQKIGSFIDNL